MACMARFLLAALFLMLVPQAESIAQWEVKLKTEDRNEPCTFVVRLSQKEAKYLHARLEQKIATSLVDACILCRDTCILGRASNGSAVRKLLRARW